MLNKNIVEQLSKSATSIGVNYHETNNASSKKDFINKIYFCKKEANETRYWLDLLNKNEIKFTEDIGLLKKENQELVMIFQKIINTSNNKH
ncbi:MAG: four helix bundle protein [Patescibacteria group bacterium]